MKVQNLCQRDIVHIDQAATLGEAARLMRSQHVGALVITSQSEGAPHATGIVTDRDLAVEILARDLGGADVRIGQVASHRLVAVPGDADPSDAAALMREHGVRRLLVTAADGQLVGLLSSDDLVEALATELTGLAQALRSDIERERSERGILAAPVLRPVFLPAGTPGMRWPGPGDTGARPPGA